MAKLLTGTRIYGTGTVDTQLFVNGTEQSTSTTTGALEVVGGAGIGGNLYVGGISVLPGVQATNIVASGTLGVTGTTTLGILNAGSATFSGVSTVTNTTAATSTATGALQILGGVGIGGNLYVQQTSYINGSQILTAATIGNFGVSTITAGTDTVVTTSTGAVLIYNTSTLQSVTDRGAVTTNRLNLNNGVIFGSTANVPVDFAGNYTNSVGSFIRANGFMVGTTTTTALYALNFQHNLAPVSTTTINSYYGNLFLPTLQNTANYGSMYGTFARIDMAAAATSGTVGTWYGFFSANPSRNAAANVPFTSHIGFYAQNPSAITATNVYGVQSVINSGVNRYNIYANGTADNYFNGNVGIGGLPTVKLDVTGAVKISGITTVTNTTAATSTASGALQVIGGAGINGALYTGGLLNVGGSATITGVLYADELRTRTGQQLVLNAGESAGQATGQTNELVYINAESGLEINSSPDNWVTGWASRYTTTIGDAGGNSTFPSAVSINGTTASTSTTTGALTVAGGVGIGGNLYVGGTVHGTVNSSTNLAGGSQMAIVYQSAANTTAFLAAGSAGFLLQTNGTGAAPTWVSASGVSAGSATNADNIRTVTRSTNATHFLTFVDSDNVSNAYEALYTDAGIAYNPSTNDLTIGGDLTVNGNQVTLAAVSTRDKYRVWNDGTYTIGMQTPVTFGAVNNDYAMTFQMSNTDARGFWWGDSSHSTAQGAMSLSTNGKLSVAHSVRLGYGESDAVVPGATYRLDVSGDTYISGNVGIGIAPAYKLHVDGSFAATTKSFVIDHPTKPGMKLRYGSLEGPENGVYVRGRLTGKNTIELPEYWTKLVDPDSITVTLTPIGAYQKLYVKDIKDNSVIVGGTKAVNCFYVVYGERRDVGKLEVEIE